MGHAWPVAVVGWVAWTTAGLAFVAPRQVLGLWPARRSASSASCRLGALDARSRHYLVGCTAGTGRAGVRAVDTVGPGWGGRMGTGAAILNGACASASAFSCSTSVSLKAFQYRVIGLLLLGHSKEEHSYRAKRQNCQGQHRCRGFDQRHKRDQINESEHTARCYHPAPIQRHAQWQHY